MPAARRFAIVCSSASSPHDAVPQSFAWFVAFDTTSYPAYVSPPIAAAGPARFSVSTHPNGVPASDIVPSSEPTVMSADESTSCSG